MSAVSQSGEHIPRSSRFARWAAQQDASTSPAAWLFGEPNEPARELAELRERLAEAERRADDAEAALPHLLALGQRTVNSLLSDARARGRQIIEEARAEAEREAADARKALEREAAELDALRMAVACEAMGLEEVRNELEARLAELGAGPDSAAPALAPAAEEEEATSVLPPPPAPADLASVGMSRPAGATADRATSHFADAWARGEDEMMAEAFDRFFAAHIENDPLRDAVVEPEPEPEPEPDPDSDPASGDERASVAPSDAERDTGEDDEHRLPDAG